MLLEFIDNVVELLLMKFLVGWFQNGLDRSWNRSKYQTRQRRIFIRAVFLSDKFFAGSPVIAIQDP